MPSYMMSSGISLAPASIMTTFSPVAATVTSIIGVMLLLAEWGS